MDLLSKLIPHEDEQSIHAGEAYVLWAQLVARYDGLEIAEAMVNVAHDTDFKKLVEFGLDNIITNQIEKLEKKMIKYNVPFPERPAKHVRINNQLDEIKDESMYRLIFDTSQSALMFHIKAINICVNDELREMFMEFLKEEMDMYDKLVKYGKFKNWVRLAPSFKY